MIRHTPVKLLVLDQQLANRIVCTVVTEDMRLRQEVSTLYSGEVESVRVFEAPATKEELTKVDELLSDPEFQTAKQNIPQRIHGRDARIVTIIGDHRSHSFFDDGRGRLPKSVAVFLKFTEATRKKGLPKVTGNPELICPIPLRSALKITHATE